MESKPVTVAINPLDSHDRNASFTVEKANEVDYLRQTIVKLQKENIDLQKEKIDMLKELETLQLVRDNARNAAVKITAQTADLEKKVNVLLGERDSLQESVETLKKRADKFEKENDELKEAILKLQEILLYKDSTKENELLNLVEHTDTPIILYEVANYKPCGCLSQSKNYFPCIGCSKLRCTQCKKHINTLNVTCGLKRKEPEPSTTASTTTSSPTTIAIATTPSAVTSVTATPITTPTTTAITTTTAATLPTLYRLNAVSKPTSKPVSNPLPKPLTTKLPIPLPIQLPNQLPNQLPVKIEPPAPPSKRKNRSDEVTRARLTEQQKSTERNNERNSTQVMGIPVCVTCGNTDPQVIKSFATPQQFKWSQDGERLAYCKHFRECQPIEITCIHDFHGICRYPTRTNEQQSYYWLKREEIVRYFTTCKEMESSLGMRIFEGECVNCVSHIKSNPAKFTQTKPTGV